jgi:predicted nuclease with TOPRIM domain
MLIEMLVPTVVGALVPFFKRSFDKIADKSADEIFEQRGKIWDAVKGVFVEDDLTLLRLFEENPDDPKTQGKLEGKLEERLKTNPEAAVKLEELVAKLKEMSSEITNEQIEDSTIENEMKRGEGKAVIRNTGIRGSKITNKMI